MPVCSYGDLEKAMKGRGLKPKKAKKGVIWKGFVSDKYVRIAIHTHAKGKDVPTGLFNKYVKELGFASQKEFFYFLKGL